MNRRTFRRQITTRTATAIVRLAGTSRGERLAHYVDTLNRLLHNDSGNVRINGEAWLLSQLAGGPTVVFDIGANRGAWTEMALEALHRATIHAFEPIPDTFADLAQRLGSSGRVRVNQLAVTNHSDSALVMWTDGRDGTMSSATADPTGLGKELRVACTTGDDYARANGIDHIDLLKVDVEGHEMEVLEGFQEMFSRGAIDLVQFEFTLWAAISRHWLADYYQFFSERGFRVGKLWPRAVRWKDYAAEDEQFLRCNFVAARLGTSAARKLGADELPRPAFGDAL